jgi:hypothetical protein
VYRHRVAEADTAPGGDLPVIRADIRAGVSGTRPPPEEGLLSGFGHNTVLALSIGYEPPGGAVSGIHGLLGDDSEIEHADIRVWLLADTEGVGYADDLDNVAARWVLVHEQSVSCDTLIMLRDIPAGRYCVTVDRIEAGSSGSDPDVGTVTIFEQHTD